MAWKNAKGGFVYWLNRFLNPNHAWTDYYDPTRDKDIPKSEQGPLNEDKASYGSVTGESSSLLGVLGQALPALVAKWTDAAATPGEYERNAMQMQNQEDIYQRQVTGMQKAGVNPALMYGSGGAASAPSVNTQSAGASSMSELMQLYLLPAQKKLLEAQGDKTKSEGILAEKRAENMALVNQYYPEVTEASIEKTLSSIGVDFSTIDKNDAEIALKNIQAMLADNENKYAEQFFKARAELEEAKTQEAKDAAAAHAANALMTGYEYTYAKNTGFKLASSAAMAIVAALGSALHLDKGEVSASLEKAVDSAVKNHPGINVPQAFGMNAANTTLKDDFKRFREKGKRFIKGAYSRSRTKYGLE